MLQYNASQCIQSAVSSQAKSSELLFSFQIYTGDTVHTKTLRHFFRLMVLHTNQDIEAMKKCTCTTGNLSPECDTIIGAELR